MDEIADNELTEEEYEYRPAPVVRLAKLLFQINLLPSIVAIIAAGFALCIAIFNFNGEAFGGVVTLAAGLLCELFYYQQSRDEFLKRRALGWVYSVLINLLCAFGFIASFINTLHIVLLLVALYPLFFLGVSCYALYCIWQEHKQRVEIIEPADGAEY